MEVTEMDRKILRFLFDRLRHDLSNSCCNDVPRTVLESFTMEERALILESVNARDQAAGGEPRKWPIVFDVDLLAVVSERLTREQMVKARSA